MRTRPVQHGGFRPQRPVQGIRPGGPGPTGIRPVRLKPGQQIVGSVRVNHNRRGPGGPVDKTQVKQVRVGPGQGPGSLR